MAKVFCGAEPRRILTKHRNSQRISTAKQHRRTSRLNERNRNDRNRSVVLEDRNLRATRKTFRLQVRMDLGFRRELDPISCGEEPLRKVPTYLQNFRRVTGTTRFPSTLRGRGEGRLENDGCRMPPNF